MCICPLDNSSWDQGRARWWLRLALGFLTGDQYVIDGLSSCDDSMSDLRDLREEPVKLGRKPFIVLSTTTSYWLVVLRLLINGARLFYNSFKQDVNRSWSICWRVQKGIFPVREALWPEWEPRVTGMDVVGIRLVQSKQEQRVGHGAVHLHSYILPLNNNIPPISVSLSSIAAQRSLTCLGLTATYAAVCQNWGPASVHPLFIERRNADRSVALCTGRMFAQSHPLQQEPWCMLENVGVGMPDGHGSGTIDWTQDGLKERQDRTVQIMSWLEVYSETRDVYLKQEQRYWRDVQNSFV